MGVKKQKNKKNSVQGVGGRRRMGGIGGGSGGARRASSPPQVLERRARSALNFYLTIKCPTKRSQFL